MNAEAVAQRTARALRALSQCNRALVRATSEPELLAEICRVLVETAGYRLAWVGFAEHDQEKTVRPVAQAGFEHGYLETVNVTWADTERGRGPVGTSIRTAAPCVIKDTHTDPRFAPWRAEAVRRGYAACAGLPLLAEGKAFGALTVYAPEPHAFDREELDLLTDLADNLAYGIAALDTRAALRRSHDELERRVAQRTAELTSEKRLLRRLLDIHETERQMVAYEIHDTFVQHATGALMRLEALQAQCRRETNPSPDAIQPAIELLRQSIAAARQLISGLRPPILDESGIVAAIEYLVCEEQKYGTAEIEFRCDVRFGRLTAPAETAIFRIVQESLTNARRHSGSKRVQVTLAQKGGHVLLSIEDWGAGFDWKKVPKDHFGLRGVHERARLLGGRATVRSARGKGTRIAVRLPIEERQSP